MLEKKTRMKKIQVCAHFVFLDVFRVEFSTTIKMFENKNLRNQKCIKFKSLINLTALHLNYEIFHLNYEIFHNLNEIWFKNTQIIK